ncbi:competence type IV pilus ATPase ComGA [Staphylococcus petrasii]|uniref:competence type IV pilus ATPase ComGA n=1 Tax=Staphylococcus petrasii TaxID=1276936 RepID=UPI000CD01316|nr:competence type IV pilus ATPase ComGA [Staphylococcus petrasii]MCI2774479.1 Flp pilus assembly complex ATPase component TadA [Staphylococcus petrasii]PNZ79902.1 competence protein ComGA [Staphylococcus petrasii]TGA82843.1 type II/IV secretion system protein [Staphylococcus petrasii]SUM59965.1 competence protein ComGA [Staphylococcus petrasii]
MKLLFKEIVNKAISKNASDIHFIPAEDEVYIKFRVNDNLELYETFKISIYQKLLVYMKFQAGLDVSTQQIAQSGRYTYQAKGLYYLRISTLPLSLGTESCVIRIIPQYFQSKKEYKDFKDFKHLMNKKQGLILFTGPTGSGKSTLMYQMVLYAYEKLNLNVITIENPVEQLLKGITQVSINKKAGIDYISSFKAILRCDPDVILIGEIRDAEVAKCVIQASLSGHLVLSTMHSSNCKGAILRLLEMGISIQEISQAINLISNQRLITTLSNQRQLVCELINNNQIQYFFEHNNTLPKNFNNLKDKLLLMSKEGTICEETADKYL